MAGDGALTSGEFEAATSPEYYRTMREHLQPFEDASGAVCRAGLRLLSSEVHRQRCVLRAGYLGGRYESAAAYGRTFAQAVSAFTRGKVMRAFQHRASNRSAEERGRLVDEAFERFARKVAARPLSFGIDNVMALLVVVKDPPGGSQGKVEL